MKLSIIAKCILNANCATKIRFEYLKNNFLLNKNPKNYDKLRSVKQFSTTAPTRSGAIPPLLWLIVKPLTKLSALIAGRLEKLSNISTFLKNKII